MGFTWPFLLGPGVLSDCPPCTGGYHLERGGLLMQLGSRCIDYEVKPILRSDEEKELHVTLARGQRKLVVKNFSQIFVKNAFYFL